MLSAHVFIRYRSKQGGASGGATAFLPRLSRVVRAELADESVARYLTRQVKARFRQSQEEGWLGQVVALI